MSQSIDKVDADLFEALQAGDIALAGKLVEAGADVNARNQFGETILEELAGHHDTTGRRDGVIFLLARGANPRLVNPEGSGPLFSAVIAGDIVVLRLLLDAGADPNGESSGPETLYDWASTDYCFEVHHAPLPREPTEEDKASEDAWLDYLDRIAMKYYKARAPDHHLIVGAITGGGSLALSV